MIVDLTLRDNTQIKVIEQLKQTEKLIATVATKLSKGKTITTEVISNICDFLNCQPGDIMEYVPDNSPSPTPGPDKE